MKLTNNFESNVKSIQKELNVGNTFDMIERIVDVHNTIYHKTPIIFLYSYNLLLPNLQLMG